MQGFSENIQYLGLIFARIFGLFFIAPILSSDTIRFRTKTILALLMAIVLYPVTASYLPALPQQPGTYGLMLLGQLAIGLIIGFMLLIIISAFQLIGEVFSLQMGISFSEVLDPQSQVSLPILGILKNAIGILIFLSVPFQMDGRYASAFLHMLHTLARSFQVVPDFFFSAPIQGGVFRYIDQAFGLMFLTALKTGIPLIGILFISSLTLGLLGRAAPQMNLISMGIQVNIMVGIVALILLVPVIVPLMGDAFVVIMDRIEEMLYVWPRPS